MLLAVAGFAAQARVRVTDSLLPQIAADFRTTVDAAAIVVTAYAMTHVSRLGQIGLAAGGGFVITTGYITLAATSVWWLAPAAAICIGLVFYMLHNTLQTNATQMTPQARGTAVAIFSSAIFIGQTIGVFIGSLLIDRTGAAPLFVGSAIALPILAVWFAAELRRHRTSK